jgi:hypothetical protein
MDHLKAIDEAIQQYILERRQKVNSFVESHFSLPDTFLILKKNILADLLFYPLNALWSIPYVSAKKSVEFLDKLGWMKFNSVFERVPSGFKTRYQKEIEKMIVTELLEPSVLMEALGKNPQFVAQVREGVLHQIEPKISQEVCKELDKYLASQVLISDVASSMMTLLAGRLFFGDESLGVFGIGDRIARAMARDRAASKFFLGKGAGSVFYKVFPVAPSRTQVFLATLAVGLLLTGFSLLTSVLSDPLRKTLGLQQRKLHSLLDNLEEKLFLVIKKEIKKIDQVG